MRLLANENFPLTSVRILASAGYDIKYVGTESAGILDSEVMEMAISEERTILTFDRDYGELIFKRGFKPLKGVIYLRWNDFQPEDPAKFLLELFSEGKIKFEQMLTVIGNTDIRQRKY